MGTVRSAGWAQSPFSKKLRQPRVDVFVPRSLGRINHVMQALPRRAREWVGRRLGVDRITWEADRSARAAYEARAAASDSGGRP